MRDQARELIRRAVTEVHAGTDVAREASLAPPRESTVIARIGYGAGLPFAILGRVLRDPFVRRQYLRTTGIQAGVTVVAGAAITVSSHRIAAGIGGGLLTRGFAFWSSLYATLCVVEWIVVALSRQHGDQLSRAAAVIAGVPPEDEPKPPRVRIDLPWVWRRLKRHLRGLKVFACGLPLIACTSLVPFFGGFFYALFMTAWGAYWLVVLAAAKTAHGWTDADGVMLDAPGRPPPPDPWFVRTFAHVTRTVIGFRWWLPRLYLRKWRELSVSIFPPCLAVEEVPAELAGIALVRAVAGLPGFYLLLRPVLPVAAAHAILIRRRQRAAALPGTAARAQTSAA